MSQREQTHRLPIQQGARILICNETWLPLAATMMISPPFSFLRFTTLLGGKDPGLEVVFRKQTFARPLPAPPCPSAQPLLPPRAPQPKSGCTRAGRGRQASTEVVLFTVYSPTQMLMMNSSATTLVNGRAQRELDSSGILLDIRKPGKIASMVPYISPRVVLVPFRPTRRSGIKR